MNGSVGVSVHITSAKHLAPQEVYRPEKHQLKGIDELTRQDKRRMRRQSKTIRRSENVQKENRLATQAALDPRRRGAFEKRKALKTLQKDKNVTLLPQVRRQLGHKGA